MLDPNAQIWRSCQFFTAASQYVQQKSMENFPKEYEPADRSAVLRATAAHDAQPMTWDETDDLQSSPWIYTFVDGYKACLLCMKWMIDQHVASVKHKKKHTEYVKCSPSEREDWIDPIRLHLGRHNQKADIKWSKMDADGKLMCVLCQAGATSAHLQSLPHRQEVGMSEWNIEHSRPLLINIKNAEKKLAREMASSSASSGTQAAAVSTSVARAGLPVRAPLALQDTQWVNISIYAADGCTRLLEL